MDRDRNLIFGVFAVQLRKVSPAQLVEAATEWLTDPSKDLPNRLVDAGYLKPADRDFIQRLVDEAILAYGGDAAATLAAVGGEEQVHETFAGTIVLTKSGDVKSALPHLSADDSLPGEAPGVDETPGRYTHISEYARGGMGRVLLVHDQHLTRDIAMKELLPSLLGSDTGTPTPVRGSAALLSRFLQEARITGQLEHPSIVPVYELGKRKDGALYYTMKLVRGRTLSKAIKEAGDLEGRLKLLPHFVDLCNAIAYAHSRGVIHRDLKPANVMVGEFGETVVLDWGLAKVKGREDAHADGLAATIRAMNTGDEAELARTVYGHAIGTPAYMPPEQARGQLDQIDERSDVYSLGAVLYELLTGESPYQGSSTHEILYKVMEQSPVPVSTLVPDLPPELGAICERAIKREPLARLQSAKALVVELERFQSGLPVDSYRYSIRENIQLFLDRHRIGASVTGAALLSCVIIFTQFALAKHYVDRKIRSEVSAKLNGCLKLLETNENMLRIDANTYASNPQLLEAWTNRNVSATTVELSAITLESLSLVTIVYTDTRGRVLGEPKVIRSIDDALVDTILTRWEHAPDNFEGPFSGLVYTSIGIYQVVIQQIVSISTSATGREFLLLARLLDESFAEPFTADAHTSVTLSIPDFGQVSEEEQNAWVTLTESGADSCVAVDGDRSAAYTAVQDPFGAPVVLLSILTRTDMLFYLFRSLRWAIAAALLVVLVSVLVRSAILNRGSLNRNRGGRFSC